MNNVAMNMVYDFKSLLSVLSGTPLEEALLGLPFIISFRIKVPVAWGRGGGIHLTVLGRFLP